MSISNVFYEELENLFGVKKSRVRSVEILDGKEVLCHLKTGPTLKSHDPRIVRYAKLATCPEMPYAYAAASETMTRPELLQRCWFFERALCGFSGDLDRYSELKTNLNNSQLVKLLNHYESRYSKEVGDDRMLRRHMENFYIIESTKRLGHTPEIKGKKTTNDLLDELSRPLV